MKRSDWKAGMWVLARLPWNGQLYPAKIRVLAQEDVHVDWGGKARAECSPERLPAAIGFNDLHSQLIEETVVTEGQAPATTERPSTFPVDLDEKPRGPYQSEPFPKADSVQPKNDYLPTDEIRDSTSWPFQWEQFRHIVRERRRLIRMMRANMGANYLFTSVVDAVETTHQQDQLRVQLAENHMKLTKLKLSVLTLFDEHYDYDPSFKTGRERSQEVDGNPPAGSP